MQKANLIRGPRSPTESIIRSAVVQFNCRKKITVNTTGK